MSVTSSQPLFPNRTGGFPGPQQTQQQQLYQQSMNPPTPSLPQQYHPSVIYENPTQQPQSNTSYNPFMQQPQQTQPPPINTNFMSNPYNQQLPTPQSLYQSPAEQSPRQQYPPTIYENGGQEQPQQQMNPFLIQNQFQDQNQNQNAFQQNQQQQASNPYFTPQQQTGQEQYQQQQYRQQTYPLAAQPTGRADKRSILDLYNYPQLAPVPLQQYSDPNQQQQQQAAPTPVQSPPTAPASGSKNPFALSGGNTGYNTGQDTAGNTMQFPPAQSGPRHMTHESISVNDAGAWTNGRHSPDAWGSISARAMR